jgi:hypothetical protein
VGGTGSGRWTSHDKKRTVDECLRPYQDRCPTVIRPSMVSGRNRVGYVASLRQLAIDDPVSLVGIEARLVLNEIGTRISRRSGAWR